MFFINDIYSFKRGKDKRKRKQKMSKLGAAVRIGTGATIGAGVGALMGIPFQMRHGNKALGIGAAAGAGYLGGAVLADHVISPYSPVGKKKWNAFPDKHPMRKLMLQDMSRIDRIGND